MTTDEIIEMAQECKLIGMRPHLDGIYSESLVAFAALVAAKAIAELESQEPDVQETLHWYAFNYRQAHTAQAHEMWLELEQFVDRKMKAPQRTEQERDEILQAITDPENQPSQFGTVTLEYHQEKMKQWEDLFDQMSANFERVSEKVLEQRIVPLYTISPQRTEQEPVGRFAKFTDGVWRPVTDYSAGVPLYTHPPQRTWVGLTDEEIDT